MFCKKCGNQLTGMENACPNCGTPVNSQNNMNVGQNQGVVQQQNNQQLNQSAQPMNNQQMQGPYQQYMQPANNNIQNNKTIVLIIALAFVFIVALILFLFVFTKKDSKKTDSANNNSEQVTEPTNTETTINDNTENYAGYTFTIPEGYNSEITTDGLLIYNNTIAYIIQVDYSYSYETYKQAFIQKYPDQANNMIVNLQGKEYLAAQGEIEPGKNGVIMVTAAATNSSFVIAVANYNFTTVTIDQVQDLGTIINSATQGKSTFSPGSQEDAGKNGIITGLTNYKDSIKFNK